MIKGLYDDQVYIAINLKVDSTSEERTLIRRGPQSTVRHLLAPRAAGAAIIEAGMSEFSWQSHSRVGPRSKSIDVVGQSLQVIHNPSSSQNSSCFLELYCMRHFLQ